MKLICILTIFWLSTFSLGQCQDATLLPSVLEPEIQATYAIYSMLITELRRGACLPREQTACRKREKAPILVCRARRAP